jgi:hypothetical protein
MRLGAIRDGDVVKVNIRGRAIFGIVTAVDLASFHPVSFEPLCPGAGYRHARPHQVVGHWRKMGRPRRRGVVPAPVKASDAYLFEP